MAHVVTTGIGLPRRVPWADYADGRTWELIEGTDFDQDPEHARRAAIMWALRRGRSVRTSVSPGRLLVEFQP